MWLLKRWWYKIQLRKRKEQALFEVGQDINYILAFKGDMVEYDESRARKRMSELKSKGESITDKEEMELDKILEVIAESKATKNEYRQSMKLQEDLKKYISLL